MRIKAGRSNGMTFVTAVFTLLLFSVLAGAFESLIKRQSVSSVEFTMDEELFFAADSGIEMSINWLYQDDPTTLAWWYKADPANRSRLLPNYQDIPLKDSLIDITSQYAATNLISDIGVGETSIEVNSTTDFPANGVILINTEWIQYFAKTDTEFLGCIRGYSVSDPDTHSSSTYVYPACDLSANITSTDTTIPVTTTTKFLPQGTIFIGNEAIKYNSKDSTNFLECSRGSFDTTPLPHPQSEKVFPAPFEIYITSTAKKNSREITVEALLQYQYGSKWE